MTQTDKALQFRALHRPGRPLALYNIWDAGGAATLARAGAPAVATGSWSMAAAHGYPDGERMPLELVLTLVGRIVETVDLPITVDFEGAYALAPAEAAENVRKLIAAGAVGLNIEDRIVHGEGLHPIADQAERIAAAAGAAEAEGVPLFINARTDLFLGTDPATHAGRVDAALERAAAYASAGAAGFFVPGLTDLALIARIARASPLPVNVMMMGDLTLAQAAEAGAARASYGPG
ncbi:MAG: isocitrate lyase/phosphoenolpyruvate mutase family protein, partial [Pseudomonadota bacterium]